MTFHGLSAPFTFSTKIPVVEHLLAVGIERPVVAFPGIVVGSRYFDETVIERKIVSDRILPTRLAALVEREVIGDVMIYATESDLLVGRALDGHSDEGRIRVRWSDEFVEVVMSSEGQPA